MSPAFRVGIFAIATIIGVFIVWAVLGNFSLRRNSYSIGVHFRNVVGLQEGSSVQVAGVDVGLVDSIRLLPDQTAMVICSINGDHTIYRGSVFTVTTTLTGQSTLTIFPPANIATSVPLPRHVLPESEQPEGVVPPTLADLVNQGQKQLKNLDKTLAIVNTELPGMVNQFNDVATHTNKLIVHADKNFTQLGQQLNATVVSANSLVASIQTLVAENGRNISAMTTSMRQLVIGNGPKLTRLIDSLSSTAQSLDKTMSVVSSIATDPSMKANLLTATANLKDSSEKLKAIAGDIENITGDPNVQSELKGAVHDLGAAIAKANDILGTMTPQTSAQTQPGANTSPGPQPAPTHNPGGVRLDRLRTGGFDLAEAQVRETWDKGNAAPASELNIDLLPRWPTHITFGAYDIGYHTTYNFLLDMRAGPNFGYAFGVYHSYLGLKTVFRPLGPLAIDARLYDPKRPKLDLYGDLRLARRLQLFYGERSLLGPFELRTPQFGFQINY